MGDHAGAVKWADEAIGYAEGFVTFSHCRRTMAAVDERNETSVLRRLSFPA
jgi:hypothetical protein